MDNDQGRKGVRQWLSDTYRVVFIKEKSFEEKKVVRMKLGTIFVWVITGALLVSGITYGLLCIPPIKENLVPGYPEGEIRKKALSANIRADSIEKELNRTRRYLSNLRSILRNEPLPSSGKHRERSSFHRKEEDLSSKELESDPTPSGRSDRSIHSGGRSREIPGTFFFTPLRGTVTRSFEPSTGHYGVDIVAPRNASIKATLDGTVVLASWTADAGHVIQVQHKNDLVSIYKHNSVLLKEAGDQVKEGEPIAIIGNTGELTDGPHLHFELWQKGSAVNPQNYLTF